MATSTLARWRFRLRLWLADHPPAHRAVHSAIFAQAIQRLARRRVRSCAHPAAPALAAAIESITGGGDRMEAEWISRIEARRESLGVRPLTLRPIIDGVPPAIASAPRPAHRLAHVSSIHRPWGAFLMTLARRLRPESCVEFGAAVGISAAYQGAGLELNGTGRLYSIEHSPALIGLAAETLASVGISRVELVQGEIEKVLVDVLDRIPPVQMAYVDASKRGDESGRHFQLLLPHLAPGAVIVIDDIHWSGEMRRTWREIRSHPQVDMSVDLWRLGVCLMSDER